MERKRAAELLHSEMQKHGLVGWTVRLNQNSDSRFLGLCSYKDKCIILSAHHVDIHPEPDVINTIRHEIAHALCPGEGHNDVWRNKAREIGCDNTLPCSNLSLSPEVIDAIRSGATVEVTFDEQVIRTPRYNITRLQDKCEVCGKVARTLSEKLVEMPGDTTPNMKLISLECGHTAIRKIPKGTPFHLFQMGGDTDCKHTWNKNKCEFCGRFKPYAFQLKAMEFLEAGLSVNNGAACFDDMGLGKSSPISALVATPSGFRPMGSLAVGELVIASDGKAYPITGIYPQGELDVFKVIFSDYTHARCSEDHLWIVNTPVRKYRKQPNLVKSFKELKDDLYQTTTNSSGKLNNKWYIPITQPVEFDSTEVSVDPYALGLLLGDGCFYDAYQVSFTKPDNELHEYLGWTRRDDTSFAPIEVREKLYSYGLIGTRANSKFIPEDYKFNSVENRWALLAGLMDTDGSVWDNGVVEYTTVSPHLRDGVIFLVQSLGGTCRLTGKEEPKYTYKGETFIGQMAYRIVVNIPKNPFRLRRKAELWNKLAEKKKYHPTRAIIGYDYIGKEECQCISVASPDHSYLLEDFIVTHNTIDAGGVAFFHPEWNPVLWIVKSALKYQTASFIMNWMGDAHVPQIINTSKDWLIPNLKHYIVGYDMLVPKTRTMKSGKIVNSGFDITQFDRVEIKLVILDECQQIKNVDSTRTQMVRRVVKNRKVIPLSGTPWNNRGSELFPVLNMMDPMKFNSEERFKMNWVDYYWQGSFRKEGGIRKIQQFKEFTKDLLIRRERNEVMRELPEVNRTKLNVIMDAQQEQTYDDAVEEFVTWFQEQSSDISGMHLLAAMAKMRHLVALAKIPTTLEYVDEFVEDTDRKIVIFAHHQDVQSLLYEELRSKYSSEMPVLRFVAGMKSEEVDKVQTTFNNSPRTILVASQLAAGEGLNLQTCCDCVMHERQFNASKEEQCEGRFVRIGSTATSVNSVYAHMQGLTAIDATLDAIVERKRIQFHALMNKGEAPKWNEEAIVKELAVTIVNAHHAKKSRRKVS